MAPLKEFKKPSLSVSLALFFVSHTSESWSCLGPQDQGAALRSVCTSGFVGPRGTGVFPGTRKGRETLTGGVLKLAQESCCYKSREPRARIWNSGGRKGSEVAAKMFPAYITGIYSISWHLAGSSMAPWKRPGGKESTPNISRNQSTASSGKSFAIPSLSCPWVLTLKSETAILTNPKLKKGKNSFKFGVWLNILTFELNLCFDLNWPWEEYYLRVDRKATNWNLHLGWGGGRCWGGRL